MIVIRKDGGSVLMVLSLLVLIVIPLVSFIYNFKINLVDYATLAVAVIAICYTWYIHVLKQISLLQTCKKELDAISEDSVGFKKEFEKGSFPLYSIKRLDATEFCVNLDATIMGRETIELKAHLLKINDKSGLINEYLKRILDYYFECLKNDKKHKTEVERWREFTTNSQIYRYLQKRLSGTLVDLDQSLCQANCILTERFDIK